MRQSTMVRQKRLRNTFPFMVLILISFVLGYRHVWPLIWSEDVTPVKKYSTIETYIGKARHWVRTLNDEAVNPNLLLLVLTNDEFSWGRNSQDSPPRTFQSFLDMINSTYFPAHNLSLGLFTSSKDEYIKYIKTLEMETTSCELFVRVRIIYCSEFDGKKHSTNGNSDREMRHDPSVQKERRRLLARLRNYLMLSSLRSEDHIVWFDADTYITSNNLLQTFITQSSNSKTTNDLPLGLLTVRCRFDDGSFTNFDTNAWVGPRQVPNEEELAGLRKGDVFVPMPTSDTKMLDVLVEGTSNDDLIKLDSVGGTVLYIKADLVQQGLIFPPYYAVGTEWIMQEAWDGIETEGLCYIAKNLGYGCYALGGDWVVTHTNY